MPEVMFGNVCLTAHSTSIGDADATRLESVGKGRWEGMWKDANNDPKAS